MVKSSKVERIGKLKDLSDFVNIKTKDVDEEIEAAIEEGNRYDEMYWLGVRDCLEDVEAFIT